MPEEFYELFRQLKPKDKSKEGRWKRPVKDEPAGADADAKLQPADSVLPPRAAPEDKAPKASPAPSPSPKAEAKPVPAPSPLPKPAAERPAPAPEILPVPIPKPADMPKQEDAPGR